MQKTLLLQVAESNFPTMNGNVMQKKLKSIIALLVLVCLLLSGCTANIDDESNDSVSTTTTDSVVDKTTSDGTADNASLTGDSSTTSSTDSSDSSTKTDDVSEETHEGIVLPDDEW